MAALVVSLSERVAEAVRQFPVLYDKGCSDFKDKNKIKLAWEDVAKLTGLKSGGEAKSAFTNLRTRYSRDRKKLKKATVSGSGSDGVSQVKEDVEDMFTYLAWLDPYYKPRKTATNFINVESGESDVEGLTEDKVSDITDSHMADTSKVSPTNNFKPHKKATQPNSAAPKGKMDQNISTAEIEVLQSIGEVLGKKQTSTTCKDEDDLFGALIASQLRQIAPERKVMVKMQVSNIIYQEMLASFSKTSVPCTGDQIWRNPQYQSQQLHSSQSSDRSQSLRRPFQVPNVLEEEPVYRPGQLFTRSQSYQPHRGFLDDLNADESS